MSEDTRPLKVYKVELFIVDTDQVGAKEIKQVIENARYPNRCISPQVVDIEERAVDWHDQHPLNLRDKWRQAYNDLFKGDESK